jgi:hypothetical protein
VQPKTVPPPTSGLTRTYLLAFQILMLVLVGGIGGGFLGLFWQGVLLGTLGGVGLVAWVVQKRTGGWFADTRWFDAVAVAMAISVGAYVVGYHHDYNNAARDDGLYPIIAAQIVEANSFSSHDSSFATYLSSLPDGKGGFTGVFPPAYPSVLAVGHLLGGPATVPWADAVLVAFATLGMYLVARRLGLGGFSLTVPVLFFALFTTQWFARRAFSESLLMFTFYGTACALLYLQSFMSRMAAVVAPSIVFLTTRSEGVLYIGAVVLFLAVSAPRERRNPLKSWFFLGGFLVAAVAAVLFLVSGSSLSKHLQGYLAALVDFLSNSVFSSGKDFNSQLGHFTWLAFGLYGLTPLLLMACLAPWRSWRPAMRTFLILALPATFFLLNPLISPDQPFFMRRFWSVFLSAVVILATAFVASFFLKPSNPVRRVSNASILATVAWSILLVMQIVQAAPITLFKEADSTMAQMGEFANVLRDSGAEAFFFDGGTVGGYAPVLHERFGLSTYYLPQMDVHGDTVPPNSPLLKADPFVYANAHGKKVALISPLATAAAAHDHAKGFFPNASLAPQGRFTLTTSILRPSCDILAYVINPETRNRVDFSRIEDACGTTPPTVFQEKPVVFHVYLISPNQV